MLAKWWKAWKWGSIYRQKSRSVQGHWKGAYALSTAKPDHSQLTGHTRGSKLRIPNYTQNWIMRLGMWALAQRLCIQGFGHKGAMKGGEDLNLGARVLCQCLCTHTQIKNLQGASSKALGGRFSIEHRRYTLRALRQSGNLGNYATSFAGARINWNGVSNTRQATRLTKDSLLTSN